jgi:hypothetical protein
MSRISTPPVIVAALLLLLAGAGALGWLGLRDGRITPVAILVMLLPLGLLLAGMFIGSGDRSQIGIAAWGLTMFGAIIPAYYVLQTGSENWLAQWRFLLAYGVLGLAGLLCFLLWVAAWTAYVPPPPGVSPTPEQTLRQRLGSLEAVGLGLLIEQPAGEPGRMLVSLDHREGKRGIGVQLTFVPERHYVVARELSFITGDKPMNASEARISHSIRPRDATHPDADLIYDARITVTPPSEAARQRLALRAIGDHVELASRGFAAFEPGDLSHLLTEAVHQSGWAWQGVFFDWQQRCL